MTVLELAPGTTLPPLQGPDLTRTVLALFAGGSGDLNPIHLDLDVARSAGLDDVFAQGMLSMAVLGRLLTGWTDQRNLRAFRVRFASITPVNAQPLCTGTVVAVDEKDGERHATVQLTVTLADGTVTLTGDAVVALP